MSRFFSSKYDNLTPYTPGEQPVDRRYIKLNTNESPYPPPEPVKKAAVDSSENLNLYCDPECTALREKLSGVYGVKKEKIIVTNGSDEALDFAFKSFCDKKTGAAFSDITYGFYRVFAEANGVSYKEIPLKEDFSLDISDYFNIGKTVFIANPNAPTGLCIPLCDIEKIVKENKNNVVVIDEAYIDFGGESALELTEKYDNLLVVRTFSKSRSMAGARLGFAVGSEELIGDLNTLRFSVNPYNVNSMTQKTGIAALSQEEYFKNKAGEIIKERERAKRELSKMGFYILDSSANFLFARSDKIGGKELYLRLKEKGILVRHFDSERIKEFNRITVGTREQMDALFSAVKTILEERL